MNGQLRFSKTAKRKGAIAEFCVEKNQHALFMPMRIVLNPYCNSYVGIPLFTKSNLTDTNFWMAFF
jgi:hypothetical protein